MEHLFDFSERRKYPRVSMNLPLECRQSHNSPPAGGLVSNVSERGMLFHSIKDIPIGSQFKTVVFFSNEFEFDGFRVVAKVIWKDQHFEPDWRGYMYGTQFVQMFEEDRRKLLNLLGIPLTVDGVSAGVNTQLRNPLPVKLGPPPPTRVALNQQRRNRTHSLWDRIRTSLFLFS